MAKGKKTGGRKPGTPNKTSAEVRSKLSKVVSDYYNSKTFEEDIADLDPKDRVQVMEKLASYVLPKMQATTLDMTVESKKTIEDKLIELSMDED